MQKVNEDPRQLKPAEAEAAKENLISELVNMEAAEVVKVLDIISMVIRAFEGKDVRPDSDQITRLINVKNILERSNFPSLSEINFQVYCRLIAYYYPEECKSFEIWADKRAEALKSYKALSSEQYVRMFMAQQAPQTSISLGSTPPASQPEKKRFSLFRKNKDQSEFTNE